MLFIARGRDEELFEIIMLPLQSCPATGKFVGICSYLVFYVDKMASVSDSLNICICNRMLGRVAR
jgi:hypothetical protein